MRHENRILRCGLLAVAWLIGSAFAGSPAADRVEGWRARIAAARAASEAGDPDRAERLYRKVVEETDPARPNLLRGQALDGLGDLLRDAGRLAEAEPCYLQSVEIWDKLLGPRQARVAVTLHNLGVVQLARGRTDQATARFERALEIWRITLGADSAEAQNTLRALARTSTAK